MVGADRAAQQDDIIGERDYEDLLRRATKGVIGNKEQAILFAELMQLPAADFTILQSKVQEGINSSALFSIDPLSLIAAALEHPMLKGKHFFDVMSREKGPTIVDVPKCALDFDQAVAPIGGEVVDKFSLILKGMRLFLFRSFLTRNSAGKTADYRIILPPKDLRYDLRVLPMQGKIKPGKVPREDISVFISCKTTVHAQGIITIEIDGGSRFFIRYNVQSEPSQFGISVDEMTMGDDAIFEGFSYRVPLLLSMLRAQLMEGKALTEEGIFRVAGDETETASAKSRINRGVFQGSHDINAIANLIKIWFRELPTPVLSEVPMDVILNADSEAKCVQEFEKIGEPNRSLMLWLLDLMSQVAMNEQSNRMNARSLCTLFQCFLGVSNQFSLAIVMGPNLYHSSETRQLSAMEALRLSQQTVSFVFHLLNHRLRFHRERMGLVQN